MVNKRNQFVNDDNLSDKSSLTHLLDHNDGEYGEEMQLLKHSPFYSENQFTNFI